MQKGTKTTYPQPDYRKEIVDDDWSEEDVNDWMNQLRRERTEKWASETESKPAE